MKFTVDLIRWSEWTQNLASWVEWANPRGFCFLFSDDVTHFSSDFCASRVGHSVFSSAHSRHRNYMMLRATSNTAKVTPQNFDDPSHLTERPQLFIQDRMVFSHTLPHTVQDPLSCSSQNYVKASNSCRAPYRHHTPT